MIYITSELFKILYDLAIMFATGDNYGPFVIYIIF